MTGMLDPLKDMTLKGSNLYNPVSMLIDAGLQATTIIMSGDFFAREMIERRAKKMTGTLTVLIKHYHRFTDKMEEK